MQHVKVGVVQMCCAYALYIISRDSGLTWDGCDTFESYFGNSCVFDFFVLGKNVVERREEKCFLGSSLSLPIFFSFRRPCILHLEKHCSQ